MKAVWVKISYKIGSWLFEGYMCSNCENVALQDRYNQIVKSKYCPNCGAYMIRETEEKWMKIQAAMKAIEKL